MKIKTLEIRTNINKMTKEEILEGNKLIAEFMGYKQTSSDKDFSFFEHPDGKGIVLQSHHDYKRFDNHGLMELRGFVFHRSWDWLMPCIGKISNECEEPEELDELKYALLCNDIETAWKFVVNYLTIS